MTVYVVIESSWNGSRYSADGASVFSKREDAERYRKLLGKRFGADSDAFIEACKVDDFENELI